MTVSGGHGSKNWVRDFDPRASGQIRKDKKILKSGAPISLWHRSFVLGRSLPPDHLRLAKKVNRVVIKNLTLLRLGEIRTGQNFLCSVVASLAVR